MIRQGQFGGVGRIAGRKLAYVRWDDGRTEEFSLSDFRKRFGVSALSIATGSPVHETVLEMRDGPAIDKKQIAIDIARAQRDAARDEIDAIRQDARNARAACTAARKRAADTCAAAKSVRAKRDALVALAHEYRLIRRAELARQRTMRGPRSPGVARAESDDEVRQNIPPELLPTWELVKRGIGRSDRKSRTETFLEWVEAHQSEIVFVEPTEEDYERSHAQRRVGEMNEEGTRRDYVLRLIAQRDRRNWSQLPEIDQRNAVKAAYRDVERMFDKRDITQRIAASKATTFEELRDAVMRMQHIE